MDTGIYGIFGQVTEQTIAISRQHKQIVKQQQTTIVVAVYSLY
jgi:hypothetical protein